MSEELTGGGKLAFGGACAVCCAVPMLVVTGAVSAGGALVGGLAGGSVALVAFVAYAVVTGRAGPSRRRLRWALAAGGTALAAVGLALLGDSVSAGRALVSLGVAAITVAAMLALVPEVAEADPMHASR